MRALKPYALRHLNLQKITLRPLRGPTMDQFVQSMWQEFNLMCACIEIAIVDTLLKAVTNVRAPQSLHSKLIEHSAFWKIVLIAL